jgi:Holliday junction resolvasome RuvABC ATP-dependent DNA helicase subunit
MRAICATSAGFDFMIAAALDRLGIDALGLDALDRAYLDVATTGPIGVEAIASVLSEQRSTIEDVVEPFLVQCGLVVRTSRGRVLPPMGSSTCVADRDAGEATEPCPSSSSTRATTCR